MIDAESTIAKRVKIERERRGWSLEVTAQAMSAAGCPIHSTAILKIERTDSRRRIQGDEIAAFAKVFEVPVGELFEPIEAAREQRLRSLMDTYREAQVRADDAHHAAAQALRDVFEVARETPDLESMGDLGAYLSTVLANPDPDLWLANHGEPHDGVTVHQWDDGRAIGVVLGGDWSS